MMRIPKGDNKPPTKWGLGDLLILLDILLLALGFFFKNPILIVIGCVLGFTMLSLIIFIRPGHRKKMMDKEKDKWDDLK